MKLGSTQRLVLDNVAARLAPYVGHRSHGEYTRRMAVASDLEKRGLLSSLPFGHPENRGLASTYQLTAAGAAARSGAGDDEGPAMASVVKKLKWHNDGERNGGSWLAADYHDPPLATVSPHWRVTRGTIGKPDGWIARDAGGVKIGEAETRAQAQRLVKISVGDPGHDANREDPSGVASLAKKPKAQLEREIKAAMAEPRVAVPSVGSVVSPSGSDVRYRVVEASEHGCRVEAIDDEVDVAAGRVPRKLHYSEKRFLLAVDRRTGNLFDDRWRGWRVVG